MIIDNKHILIMLFLTWFLVFSGSGLVSTASESDVISGVSNIPNPFRAGNETTDIRYFLSEDCSVSITIYNLVGDLVRKFPDSECPGSSGDNIKAWDGRNGQGRAVADGCYICVIIASSGDSVVGMEWYKLAVYK